MENQFKSTSPSAYPEYFSGFPGRPKPKPKMLNQPEDGRWMSGGHFMCIATTITKVKKMKTEEQDGQMRCDGAG